MYRLVIGGTPVAAFHEGRDAAAVRLTGHGLEVGRVTDRVLRKG